MDAILQHFQVFLDLSREHFVTFISSRAHHKCNDITQVLSLCSSLGQNYKLLQSFMHYQRAKFKKVDITDIQRFFLGSG